MQQNPITTYLRVAGLGIGAILFILMIYRSSQMANNPIYVKGKPFLLGQAQTAGAPYGPLASNGSLQTLATAQSVPPPASNQPETAPPAPVATPEVASATPSGKTPPGQATKAAAEPVPDTAAAGTKGIRGIHQD